MKKIIADAKQLLVDVDLFKAPINPIEVCQKLDIIYDEKAYTGFDGIFMATASKQLIGVSSNIKEQGRKYFTCAHEIGHYHSRGSFIMNQFTRELGYIFPDTYAHQAVKRKASRSSRT